MLPLGTANHPLDFVAVKGVVLRSNNVQYAIA